METNKNKLNGIFSLLVDMVRSNKQQKLELRKTLIYSFFECTSNKWEIIITVMFFISVTTTTKQTFRFEKLFYPIENIVPYSTHKDKAEKRTYSMLSEFIATNISYHLENTSHIRPIICEYFFCWIKNNWQLINSWEQWPIPFLFRSIFQQKYNKYQ